MDYKVVKREILKAYKLVPEAYRQQFHEIECKEGGTYMEFARQKVVLFNRWCTSQQIDDSFERLKQLILLELRIQEMCSCYNQNIPRRGKVATLADDYKQTHQSLNSASDTKNANSTMQAERNI